MSQNRNRLSEDPNQTTTSHPNPNPLENAGCLSQIFFSWLSPLVQLSSTRPFEQSDHWPLYSYLNIETNYPQYKEHHSQTDSIFALLFYNFKIKAKIFFTSILYNVFDVAGVFMIYYLTELLIEYQNDGAREIDFATVGLYFISFTFLELVKAMIVVWFNYVVVNEMLVFRNCYIFSVLEKSMKISLTNASKTGKGNIINLVQVDSDMIKENGNELSDLFYFFLNGVLALCLGFYVLGKFFLIFFGISFVFLVFSFLLHRLELNFEKKLLDHKDKRMSFLENAFKHLRFIKFHVFENLFLKLTFDRREKELKMIKIMLGIFTTTTFLDWMTPSLSYLTTISFIVVYSPSITLATIVMFHKLYEHINDFFQIMPAFFQTYFEFKLVNIRMNRFFEIKDAADSHIHVPEAKPVELGVDDTFVDEDEFKDKMEIPTENAIQISSGYFGYQKDALAEISDEESEEDAKTKQKSFFSLNDINLSIRSKELTFIIGKIGSGKTTLLHSILGEVQPHSKKTQISFASKSIGFCPQSPFIQTRSIKENILFYEPLDQKRLAKSIEMACLEQDLETFPDGVETILAERGINISGGQRTRINLARCFYKTRDIYLFDDPLSSLDFNVASKIMRKTIRHDLRETTRVIVTHSIQFIFHADRIVYMDKGEILFDGTYRNFKDTSWCQELARTRDSKNAPLDAESNYGSHVSMGTIDDMRSFRGSRLTHGLHRIDELTERKSQDKFAESPKSSKRISYLNQNLKEFNRDFFRNDSSKDLDRRNSRKKNSLNISEQKSAKSRKMQSSQSIDSSQNEVEDFWRNVTHQMDNSINELGSSDDSESEDSESSVNNIQLESRSSERRIGSEKRKSSSTLQDHKERRHSRKASESNQQDENQKPDFLFAESKEKIIQKYFVAEDKEEGRQFCRNFRMMLSYLKGPLPFITILVICVVNTFAEYFCLSKVYDFIDNLEEERKHLWNRLPLLYLYFCVPLKLIIIRMAILSYCSVSKSRRLHHDMMFGSLFGDLLGFHDRVESARLINRFSNDINQIDDELMYKIMDFLLFSGYLVSDLIIGVITIGWWVVVAFAVFYIILFYYQNMYVRFRKDLYRLDAITKTPLVNLTHEILDGKLIFKTFQKEGQVKRDISRLIEDNTKNEFLESALTSWFGVRMCLFNVLLVQGVCFAMIWFLLKFDMISVKKVVIFLPFVMNFIWNLNMWIEYLSTLETSLVSLERCQAFLDIPPEKNYKNLPQIKEKTIPAKLAKQDLNSFIRKLSPISQHGIKNNLIRMSDNVLSQPLIEEGKNTIKNNKKRKSTRK